MVNKKHIRAGAQQLGAALIHQISYDLHEPERDYSAVIAKIQTFGGWAHDEESVWLVDTTLSTGQCRDELNTVTTQATYFVVRLWQDWSSQGLNDQVVEWLHAAERRW